jgi:hypothetical protein
VKEKELRISGTVFDLWAGSYCTLIDVVPDFEAA